MSIGEIIKHYREENGNMSKGEFARRCGYTTTYITRLESGVNTKGTPLKPTIDCIKRVSKAMLISFDDLFHQLDPDTILSLRDGRAANSPADASITRENAVNYRRIPVLGRVAAGIPIEATEEILDYEDISQSMAAGGDFFGLRISGDSMEPKISSGDTVIVRKQDDAESGDIVIALINGNDAVCKRLKKYEEGIALVSTNPAYQPMYFSPDDLSSIPVRVIGKVVELRAKF